MTYDELFEYVLNAEERCVTVELNNMHSARVNIGKALKKYNEFMQALDPTEDVLLLKIRRIKGDACEVKLVPSSSVNKSLYRIINEVSL